MRIATAILTLVLVLPAWAQEGLDMERVKALHAEGKAHFDATANVDLSHSERNAHRKDAFGLLNEAYAILDRWCDEHPEDIDRLEDMMCDIGQMRYWIRKEAPVGLLENEDNVRRTPPPDWPPKPPDDPVEPARPAPPDGTPAPPPPPRADGLAEHLKHADEYAKAHPYDLPGIRDLYLDILEHSMPGTAEFVTALKRVADVNSRMKDYYRRLRDEDPDQLDLTGAETRRLVFALQKDLKDREADIRLRAAEFLGLLGSGDAARHLVAQLCREKEDPIREMILNSLTRIGGSKVAKELAALRKERDEELQRGALRVLMDLVAHSDVEARYAAISLGEFIFARSDEIADEAISRLEDLGPKGTLGLGNGITVGEHQRKLKVIAALAKTGDGRAAGFLSNLLIFGAKGKLHEYKQAAVEGIKAIGRSSVPYLVPAIDHPKLRQWTKFVLREITGMNFEYGAQVESWWLSQGGK